MSAGGKGTWATFANMGRDVNSVVPVPATKAGGTKV
jgi:hypothetical protein